MDTRHLTDTLVTDLDPAARPVVTRYLRDLGAALPGSRRCRAAILTEVADGLIEHVTSTTGPDPVTAATSAVRTFGSPQVLATMFARELTGKTAHRTGFALIGSGPMVGLLWLLALASAQPSGVTRTLPERISELFTTLPLLPVLLLITIPAAILAAAGGGRVARILHVTTGAAGLAGLVAGAGCAIVDTNLIGHAVANGTAWSPLLIAAVSASLVRLILAVAAARRCACARAAS